MPNWKTTVDRVLGHCFRTFGENISEETVTFLPSGGSPLNIDGIYSDAYVAVDPDTGATITSNNPWLGVRLSDFPTKPTNGDKIIVRGDTLRIYDIQDDGQGGSKFFLHRDV